MLCESHYLRLAIITNNRKDIETFRKRGLLVGWLTSFYGTRSKKGHTASDKKQRKAFEQEIKIEDALLD